jgi:hypothetical protein
MAVRAKSNPNALTYGTFHRYRFDEALTRPFWLPRLAAGHVVTVRRPSVLGKVTQ